jgi:hypothetical protein
MRVSSFIDMIVMDERKNLDNTLNSVKNSPEASSAPFVTDYWQY